jgi:hypothetical protein
MPTRASGFFVAQDTAIAIHRIAIDKINYAVYPIAMDKKRTFKLRRRVPAAKRPPQFITVAISIPVSLAKAWEAAANEEYGGNKSALATTAISKEIGFRGDVEFVAQ